jgi:hypothetical protein
LDVGISYFLLCQFNLAQEHSPSVWKISAKTHTRARARMHAHVYICIESKILNNTVMYTKEILFFLQHCTGVAEASTHLRSDAGSVGKHSPIISGHLAFEDMGIVLTQNTRRLLNPGAV